MAQHGAARSVPPPVNRQTEPPGRKGFSPEDVILTAAVVLGIGGAVTLWFLARPPAALTAVLLAVGLSALVHRFLGGLQGVDFVFGAVKLVGTMGTLMAVFFVLNHYLDSQQQQLDADLAGQWKWQYVGKGWLAKLTFQKTKTLREYSVMGSVRQGDTALYEIVGGTARRDGNGQLVLDLDVKDFDRHRDVKWQTPAGSGLKMDACFGGSFTVKDRKTGETIDSDPWGIFLERTY